jgi:FAD linked oxidases, C-terminal domain
MAHQGKLRQRQPGVDHGVGVEQEQKAKCGREYDNVVGQRGTCDESPVPGHVECCAKRHPSPIAELTKQVKQLLDPDNILNPGAVI